MPFTALIDEHPVHLAGSDSDSVWQRAQQVKREGRIRCRGCGGEMRTRSGAKTVRHFFHKAKPDACLLSGSEGATHLRIKMAITAAIEASGGIAHVEHIASDRSFVVDVLGVWPTGEGQHRVAFEVQVSRQTAMSTEERTAQRAAECDLTVWVLLRHPNADGWPVEGLALPGWSDHWANGWPSIRLDHDVALAGLVASEADGSRPQWRSANPAALVAAIGQRKALWLHGPVFSGWVTPALRQRVGAAIEAERRAEARRHAKREQHRVNIERFVSRRRDDLHSLRQGLTARGLEPEDLYQRRIHAEGMPLRAGGVAFLVLPAASQIATTRCKEFIRSHVVVADDPADRRRLKGKQIDAVTVDDALSIPLTNPIPEPTKTSVRVVAAATWAEINPTMSDVDRRRSVLAHNIIGHLTDVGLDFKVGLGSLNCTSITFTGIQLVLIPDPTEVPAVLAPPPEPDVLALGQLPAQFAVNYRHGEPQWLTLATCKGLIDTLTSDQA